MLGLPVGGHGDRTLESKGVFDLIDEALAAPSALREARRGETLFRGAAQPGSLYQIIDGWAARVLDSKNGARQITAFLLPGDYCNLETLVGRSIRDDIVALSSITLRSCQLIKTNFKSDTLVNLLDFGVQRLSDLVHMLSNRRAEKKIAFVLHDLAQRQSEGEVVERSYFFPLTQQDVAYATCLTPVHVNRILRGPLLEVVAMKSGELLVKNSAELRRISKIQRKQLFNWLTAAAGYREPNEGKGTYLTNKVRHVRSLYALLH